MKSIRLNPLAWMHPLRLLLATCICALLVLSQARPVYSATRGSSPTSGEANLTQIEKEAQKAVLENPYSREKTQAKAKEGLNEIQGAADADKQKRPENTRKGVESVEQKLQKALEKAEGKNVED